MVSIEPELTSSKSIRVRDHCRFRRIFQTKNIKKTISSGFRIAEKIVYLCTSSLMNIPRVETRSGPCQGEQSCVRARSVKALLGLVFTSKSKFNCLLSVNL